MPRTPKPETTKLVTIRVEMHNHRHLEKEARRLGISLGQIFNAELEFVRCGGLPEALLSPVQRKVRFERTTFRIELERMVRELVLRMPAVSKLTVPEPLDRTYHVASVNFAGPNREYVAKRAEARGHEFTPVMNEELLFARTFDLPFDLLARLDAHLKEEGLSHREWATHQLHLHVERVRLAGDPHEAPTVRASRRQ